MFAHNRPQAHSAWLIGRIRSDSPGGSTVLKCDIYDCLVLSVYLYRKHVLHKLQSLLTTNSITDHSFSTRLFTDLYMSSSPEVSGRFSKSGSAINKPLRRPVYTPYRPTHAHVCMFNVSSTRGQRERVTVRDCTQSGGRRVHAVQHTIRITQNFTEHILISFEAHLIKVR